MNKRTSKTKPADAHEVTIPDEVIDIYGHPVRLGGPVWYLIAPGRSSRINWELTVGWMGESLRSAFQAWIAESIEKRAPDTVENRFNGILFCLRRMATHPVQIEDIDHQAVISLRNSFLKINLSHVHQLIYLRLFYYWLAENQVPGATAQTAELIKEIALPNMLTGEAVLSRHPERGPLAPEELNVIESAIRARLPADSETMIFMLFYELGLRPIAVALLEETDFHVFRTQAGTFYQLDVPQVKKRNTERVTERRPLSLELGKAIEAHIARNQVQHGDTPFKRPLVQNSFQSHTQNRARPYSHVPRGFFSGLLQKYAKRHNLLSQRTGRILYLTPLRFRYSYGTRFAEQGIPKNELAALMDHSDDRSVIVYYKPSPKAARRLDEAIGRSAGRVWAWFKGQPPVDRPDDETTVAVVSAQTLTLKPLGGIGACGANLLCGLNVPYSCYACPKFQPWRDAAHRALLEDVRAEQKRLREFGGNNPAYLVPSALDEVERAMTELVAFLERKAKAR